MFNFVLGMALISSVSAATVILEKHALSGYVDPQFSFQKNCSIFKEGHMESVITNGDGIGMGYSKRVSREQVFIIQQLLRSAKEGEVTELPYPCDVGTTIYRGWTNGQLVELDIRRDCEDRRLNNSAAANALKKLATDICEF